MRQRVCLLALCMLIMPWPSAFAQAGTDWGWYPNGLDRELVAAKGVRTVEVVNDAWGWGFKAKRTTFDTLGRIVETLRFEGKRKGDLTVYEADENGRLLMRQEFMVDPYDFEKPFDIGKKTLFSEEKYEYEANGSKTYVKDTLGKWVLEEEEQYYRYLEGKPTQIETRRQGELAGIRFEVLAGEPEPRFPKHVPVEINRYDEKGNLVHQTKIEEQLMILSPEDDLEDYQPEFDHYERHFIYRDGLVISYSDSSFFEGEFDGHFGYKALYDAQGRQLEKHFQYDRSDTFLKYVTFYDELRIVETQTSNISSLDSYVEKETFLNDGGLPSKIILKQGNSGKGIYSKIIRTEYKYTFYEP